MVPIVENKLILVSANNYVLYRTVVLCCVILLDDYEDVLKRAFDIGVEKVIINIHVSVAARIQYLYYQYYDCGMVTSSI